MRLGGQRVGGFVQVERGYSSQLAHGTGWNVMDLTIENRNEGIYRKYLYPKRNIELDNQSSVH